MSDATLAYPVAAGFVHGGRRACLQICPLVALLALLAASCTDSAGSSASDELDADSGVDAVTDITALESVPPTSLVDAGPWNDATAEDAISGADLGTPPVDAGTLRPDGDAGPTPPVLSEEGPADVSFARVYPSGISDHHIAFNVIDYNFGYGAGGALLDFDGDDRVDVFLGQTLPQGSPPCIYRNTSTPGHIAFERDICFAFDEITTGGLAIDLENDGRAELFVYGRYLARIERFHPVRETIDLIDVLGAERLACVTGSALAQDYNHDGLIDIVLGCREQLNRNNEDDMSNAIILQDGEGGFRFEVLDDGRDGFAAHRTNTLAMAPIDYNDDGLLDIIVANDTYSNPVDRNTSRDPGGLFIRCGIGEGCGLRRVFAAPDDTRFASFMGIATPWVEGSGQAVYFTDWGPNRLMYFDGEDPVDISEPSGAAMEPQLSNVFSFSWGAIAEDFNFDGIDDLFVTEGHMALRSHSTRHPGAAVEYFEEVRDSVLLQDSEGSFRRYNSEVGISPPSYDDSGAAEFWGAAGIPKASSGSLAPPSGTNMWASASRGAARVDFDHDGRLDLLTISFIGRPRVHTDIRPDVPHRCTVIPHPRYAPSNGGGYGISRGDGPIRFRHVQGQMQLGHPYQLLAPGGSGRLRFPSGAVVAYACSADDPVVDVHEPDWISLLYADDMLSVAIDAAWLNSPSLECTFNIPEAASQTLPCGASVAVPEGAVSVMIRIDGRWFPRQFELSEL